MDTLYYTAGVLLIAYVTNKITERQYARKVYLQRKRYIKEHFPIIMTVSAEQRGLIMLDMEYIFKQLDSVRETARTTNRPLADVNDIARIANKVENNIKLNQQEITGLNGMYSVEFYDLSKLKF